jgi:serine/threonine protein kinase
MLDICTKVCMGCKYITSLRLVHMDIAARNVLVGDKNTVKVADFGLTRPMDKGQNYYRLKERLTISVKWSSVEALKRKVSSPFFSISTTW